MRLAYSTYGLQQIDPAEAIDRVAAMGYQALELNVGDDWPTAPAKLGAAARQQLRERYLAAGFPSPVLMHLIGLCGEGEDAAAKAELLARTCRLARDLSVDDGRLVVTTTLGGLPGPWESHRDRVAEAMQPYATVAADHGVTLAIEAHVGQSLDTPDKAAWLMEAVGRDSVRLNFDHSHFHVLGIDLEHAVRRCAPWAVHTHVKDGRMVDGQVQFLLPGDGTLDLEAYFRAVAAAGITVPITVEVSAQLWRRPDYDPWATAQRAYTAMRQGLDRASA